MIALVISSAWPKYYSSSPFLNLLYASHPDYKVFGKLPHECEDPAFREEIGTFDAVVTDDVLIQKFAFYNKGPKFMVGGDPHAHQPHQVQRLRAEYSVADYVLTGAWFCKRLEDRYLYPPAELWEKHVYFPHMAPATLPELADWKDRKQNALLSGSIGIVYPFREQCRQMAQRGFPIDLLDFQKFNHGEYFREVGKYRMAITCNSIFECAMAKYFEIPWLGTILVAPPMSDEENHLVGYQDNKNVIWTREPQYLDKLINVVNSDPEHFAKVAQAGAELMRKCHTAFNRLEYVSRLVDKIKTGGFEPQDALDVFLQTRLDASAW